MKFDEWIRRQGLQQTAVAEKLQVSKATVNMLIKGTRKPSPKMALRIEKATKGKVTFKDWFASPD